MQVVSARIRASPYMNEADRVKESGAQHLPATAWMNNISRYSTVVVLLIYAIVLQSPCTSDMIVFPPDSFMASNISTRYQVLEQVGKGTCGSSFLHRDSTGFSAYLAPARPNVTGP